MIQPADPRIHSQPIHRLFATQTPTEPGLKTQTSQVQTRAHDNSLTSSPRQRCFKASRLLRCSAPSQGLSFVPATVTHHAMGSNPPLDETCCLTARSKRCKRLSADCICLLQLIRGFYHGPTCAYHTRNLLALHVYVTRLLSYSTASSSLTIVQFLILKVVRKSLASILSEVVQRSCHNLFYLHDTAGTPSCVIVRLFSCISVPGSVIDQEVGGLSEDTL